MVLHCFLVAVLPKASILLLSIDILSHQGMWKCMNIISTVYRFLTVTASIDLLIVILRVFPMFAIKRFININIHIYYNMVQGRPLQLLVYGKHSRGHNFNSKV